MMRRLLLAVVSVLAALFIFAGENLVAQVTAPGSSFNEFTNYPSTPKNDPVFVFCTSENGKVAALQANTLLKGTKTWEWQRFNQQSLAFELFITESTSGQQSVISKLEDGLYRIRITAGDSTESYQAWVLNDWNSGTAGITESNCDFFSLIGSVEPADLAYYDPADGQPVALTKDIKVEWRKGETVLARSLTQRIYDPPTEDTKYTFYITDRFGCEFSADVTYISIVTKAEFKADPMTGEAPLEVKFSNNSKNGDPGSYEWFFFKNLDEIKRESERTTLPIDSFMFVKPVTNDNPSMIYENSGSYMVKLVSKKTGDHFKADSVYSGVCTDTVYMEEYIVVDTSYFAVPNVFTPNGDGTNDNFVVKFWSMQSVKISVFNRWGRTVHVWQSGNVRGFKNTYMETVWDGKIGGRYASPGVYFYVVEGTGRDGKKRWKHGNVYLIRGKE